MIVSIHQPHFLPWLGYFDRMAKADVFVLLDHVQFERQNYQNRVRIKTRQGPQWLTVPVRRRSHPEPILDKEIETDGEGRPWWARKAWRTLQFAYGGAPFFSLYGPALQGILEEPWDKLADLDVHLIRMMQEALDIRTTLVRSSELGVGGQRTELLVAICRKLGADVYLAGLGGSRDYLDVNAFDRAGIRVAWQEFRHPRYSQHPNPETFEEGLSAMDMLFNCGPQAARIIKEAAQGELDAA